LGRSARRGRPVAELRVLPSRILIRWLACTSATLRADRNLPWQGFCSMSERSTLCDLLTESLRSAVPVPSGPWHGGADAAAAWLCTCGRGFRTVRASAGAARPGASRAARLVRRTARGAGRSRSVKRAAANAAVLDRSCRARPPTVSRVRRIRRRLCREQPRDVAEGAAVRRCFPDASSLVASWRDKPSGGARGTGIGW